jgi:hypothetical protein
MVAFAAACHCRPTAGGEATAGAVASPHLTWTRDWTTLHVLGKDGSAEYDFHPHGWGSAGRAPAHLRWMVPASELQALLKTLAERSACDLHGTGRQPAPEEREATLELSFPGLHCTVTMLENDWDPRVSGPLDSLAARVAKEGTPAASAPDP